VTLQFSLKEAAAIADVPEPFVRKAIAQRTLRPRAVASGRAMRYRFAMRDMLFLKVICGFPFDLPRKDKDALRSLVDGKRASAGQWQATKTDFVFRSGDVVVHVEAKNARDALAHDLAAYRRGRRRIVSDPSVLSGEPVFKGTRIPLAHVSALIAKRVPLREIAEDYPALSLADMAFAAIHAKMKRNPGRPRKRLRLLRAPRDASVAGPPRRGPTPTAKGKKRSRPQDVSRMRRSVKRSGTVRR
jgi:uncharacterized protein (DUF433 family)